MTPEEIKKIAREYARYTCSDISDAQERATDENIEYDFALPIFEWLSERFCIVEKSKVLKEYDYYKNSWNETELTETIMESLEDIFGKDMFEEE